MKMLLHFLLLIQFFFQLLPVFGVSFDSAYIPQDASAGVIQRVHPKNNLMLIKRMEHPLKPPEVSELVKTSPWSDHGISSPISDAITLFHLTGDQKESTLNQMFPACNI